MDKISVIIPVFRDSHYIYDCLDSIFKSTYRNLEVIMVADNDFEDPEDSLSSYGSELSIHTSEFKRFEQACNFGLGKSSGEYVSFFRADDINGKMRFELSVKKLENDPLVGMVFCGTTFINEDSSFLSGISRFPKFRGNRFLGSMFEHNWIPTVSTALFRSKILQKTGGFDESFIYSSDYDLLLRTGSVSKVDYVDLPLVRFRLRNNVRESSEELRREFEIKAVMKHKLREIAASLSALYKKEEEFRLSFGRLLYRIGKKDEALKQFQRVISLNSAHFDGHFLLGNCYFDLGDYNNSLKSYNECLKLNPEHIGCINNLGILYYHKGEFEMSMNEFMKAAEINNELFEPRYNLSCLKEPGVHEALRFSFIHSSVQMNHESVRTGKAVAL